MTFSLRRVGARLMLAIAAGAVLVLGPTAALAQTPAAPSSGVHHNAGMCPIMESSVL